MSTLLSRLQSATEGSRELDWMIALATGHHSMAHARDDFFPPFSQGSFADKQIPHYTTNLQDAVSLVPEGWTWQASNRAPKPHRGRGYIHNGELQFVGVGQAKNVAYQGFEDIAATPALALCIAIIKAHESREEKAA